ncbi:hypothetical protein BKA62DRAFT_690371 [Auriculariales sp. MPI-PUGE-AT-0066]|nr:hypothetical protein BKA62DRAFT_690371 [Auriculariales sp. MPI-PUGE-AT-0066]
MVWAKPSPAVPSLNASPPARAMAIGGPDLAASYRSDFVLFGGIGANGPLDDIWLYNWDNGFWWQAPAADGGPGGRYGAVGGTDPASQGNLDLTTSFTVAGGLDAQNAHPLSEIYTLVLGGTLAPNEQTVTTKWSKTTVSGSTSSLVGNAATVLSGGGLVAAFGCSADAGPDVGTYSAKCAVQQASSRASSAAWQSTGVCPAGRYGASAAPNLNTADTTFSSQAFILFGQLDADLWTESETSRAGDVSILDIDQGTWTTVRPDGDHIPEARSGAAVVSHSSVRIEGKIVDNAADTMVFGGVTPDGKILQDLWILRAWPSIIHPGNTRWNNVTTQYIDGCASPLSPTTSTSSSSSSPSSQSTAGLPPPRSIASWSISSLSEILSAISIGLLLGALAALRFIRTSPSAVSTQAVQQLCRYAVFALLSIGYFVGVAGFVFRFTSWKAAPVLSTRFRRDIDDSTTILSTGYGRAALVIFAGLYLALAVWAAKWIAAKSFKPSQREPTEQHALTTEKFLETGHRTRTPSPGLNMTEPVTPPSVPNSGRRSLSRLLGHQNPPGGAPDADSSVNTPTAATNEQRSFEVVRDRTRKNSNARALDPRFTHNRQNQSFSRMLSDIDWMERRRSITTVGEIDYALSRMTPDALSKDQVSVPDPHHKATPHFPPLAASCIHVAIHSFLLGACVFTVYSLKLHAHIAVFAVFLVYSFGSTPRESILSTCLYRARRQSNPPTRPELNPLQGTTRLPSSNSSRGPYPSHNPAYRIASSHDGDSVLRRGQAPVRRSSDSHESDDMDDDEHQARLEHEMGRRDTIVLSVPRSRLFITNNT